METGVSRTALNQVLVYIAARSQFFVSEESVKANSFRRSGDPGENLLPALGAKALLEIVGDSSCEPARMGINRSSKRDFPIKLFALNSEGSYQRGVVQGFLRKDGSSESSFNKFLNGFGIVRFHRDPQGQSMFLHHGIDQCSRAASA